MRMLDIDFAELLEKEVGAAEEEVKNEWSGWTVFIGSKGKMFVTGAPS